MQQKPQQTQSVPPKDPSKKATDSSNGGGSTSGSTANANADEGSTLHYIEKVALELEKTFVYTLKIITREYLIPLRTFLKTQLKSGAITAAQEERLQGELNIIFDGTEQLFSAACTGLTQLNQSLLTCKRFWLVSAYESYPGYFEAYAAFLAGQERGIQHLRMLQAAKSTPTTAGEHLLRSEIIRICKELQARDCEKAWPGDLLWFCSARANHLLRLAGQQRNLHGALSESQRTWIGAHYFSRYRANVVPASKISREVERLQGPAMKGLTWTPDVERAYKRLEAISAAAGRLEAAYQTLDMSRALGDPLGFMPNNPGRIYLGKLPCVILDSAARYGLSQEVPVWMLRFSDGFGAAVECQPSTKDKKCDDGCVDERYILTCWYRVGFSTLTQVADPRGTRVVYKATSAVVPPPLSQDNIELPPGWKCVEKGRQKSYNYDMMDIALRFPPAYDAIAAAKESERHFAVVRDESLRAWADFADDVCKHRIQHQQKETEYEKEIQNMDLQRPQDSDTPSSLSSSSSSSLPSATAGQNGQDGKDENPPLKVGILGPYKIIGSDIEEVVRYEERVYRGTYTPAFMRLAINHLVAHGLGDEGIFRVAWEQKIIDDVQVRLDTGRCVTVEGKSSHFTTNTFKLLFREASTSLIPSTLFKRFAAVLELPEDRQLTEFAALLQDSAISNTRYKAIRDLFHFLHIVASNSDYNKMLSSNLSIIFSVNVFRESEQMRSDLSLITLSNEVIKSILNNFNTIFGLSVLNNATSRPLTVEPFVGLCNKIINGKVPFRVLMSITPIQETPEAKELLLSIDRDGVITPWVATEDGTRIGSFKASHKDFICAAAVGRYLWISLLNKGGIAVYDMEAGFHSTDSEVPCTPVMVLDAPNVTCILGNSGYGSVWCGAENAIHIFSAETLEKYGVIEESGIITAITAVGETVWCGVYKRDAEQQEIHVWDSATSKRIASFPAHTKYITALCATDNGTVWSGASNGVLSVWLASSYKRVKKIVHHGGSIATICSFGGQVWTGSRDKTMFIWSAETNEYVGELRGYYSESVHSIVAAQIPNNNWLVWTASSDKSVCIWKSSRLPSYFDKQLEN